MGRVGIVGPSPRRRRRAPRSRRSATTSSCEDRRNGRTCLTASRPSDATLNSTSMHTSFLDCDCPQVDRQRAVDVARRSASSRASPPDSTEPPVGHERRRLGARDLRHLLLLDLARSFLRQHAGLGAHDARLAPAWAVITNRGSAEFDRVAGEGDAVRALVAERGAHEERHGRPAPAPCRSARAPRTRGSSRGSPTRAAAPSRSRAPPASTGRSARAPRVAVQVVRGAADVES
jgi:hypothetical protein